MEACAHSSSTVFLTTSTVTTTPVSSYEDDWPTYHRDNSRSGFDPGVFPNGPLNRLWTSDRLDGDIYAEPLVIGGRVLVATEQNSVYSLDSISGRLQWHVNLGTPITLTDLLC